MGERSMKSKLPVLIFSAVISVDAFSGTVAGFGGSTEVTQISNNMQLVQQGYEMIQQTQKLREQLSKQKGMLDDMKRQGKSLTDQEWSRSKNDLKALADAVNQGNALAYTSANIDTLYRQKYKGYSSYSQQNSGTSETYASRYADWSQTNRETLIGTMRAANIQESQFSDEQSIMQTIEQKGKTANGRMEAIQVGNMIAAQQVSQMQKLRQLVMSQMQMQASFMAQQADDKDLQRAENKKYYDTKSNTTQVGDEKKF